MRHRKRRGSIHKTKAGLWTTELGFTVTPKKRKRLKLYSPTRDEARRKLRKVNAELSFAATPKAATITVRQFLVSWLAAIKPSVKAYTYRDTERAIRLHIAPFIGKARLSALTPMSIDTFYGQLTQNGVGYAVRAQVHATLRWACGQGVRQGYFLWNPVKYATAPRRDKPKVMNVLSIEEARRFLKAARKDRLWALYAVALATGARLGEIFALRWENVDLERGFVLFDINQVEVAGKISFDSPKTPASVRQARLAPFALNALREHRRRCEESGTLRPHVFFAPKGGYLRATNFRLNEFYPLLEQAGVKRIKFHEIRHSTASMLLVERNVHPIAVGQLLGHARPSVTLDTYSHLVDPGSAEAAAKMDEFLTRIGLVAGC